MCNYTVKKLPIVIRYASDQYKTVEMCDEAILENSGTWESVRNCYKNIKCALKLLIMMYMH